MQRPRFLALGLIVSVTLAHAGQGKPSVRFEAGETIFPTEWRGGEIKAKADPLPETEVKRTREVLDKALAKYPKDLLGKHLRNVYAVQKLNFFGLEYGGTNSLDAVYLANEGEAKGYTNQFLEESFHHEFSSILLRQNPTLVDMKKWESFNAEGFEFKSDGVAALREGKASLKYEDVWGERGFLCSYASSSFEEDFNVMAGGLLTGRKDFWERVEKYPRLRSKLDLLMAMYTKLSPTFTADRFRSFIPR